MIIVHIGLPKTGTTFLQWRVFAPEFGRGFYHWKNSDHVRRIRRAIQQRQPDSHEGMQSAVEHFRKRRGRRPIMITCENISSQGEGFWAGTGPSPREVGERLGSLRDAIGLQPSEFKVVVGVRRQDQMLASRYSQHSLHQEAASQQEFEQRVADILEPTPVRTGHQWLYYDEVWRALGEITGPNNLLMYSQEGLSADMPGVLRDLGHRLSGDQGALLRHLDGRKAGKATNSKSKGADSWKLGRSDRTLILNARMKRLILDHFAESNRLLVGQTGLLLDHETEQSSSVPH